MKIDPIERRRTRWPWPAITALVVALGVAAAVSYAPDELGLRPALDAVAAWSEPPVGEHIRRSTRENRTVRERRREAAAARVNIVH